MRKEFRKIIKNKFNKHAFEDIGFELIKNNYEYDITFRKQEGGLLFYILFKIRSKDDSFYVFFGWSHTESVPEDRIIPYIEKCDKNISSIFDIHYFDTEYRSNSYEPYDIRPGVFFMPPNELEKYEQSTFEICDSVWNFLNKNVPKFISDLLH